MDNNFKIKINLSEKSIEVEGTEDFINKKLQMFKDLIRDEQTIKKEISFQRQSNSGRNIPQKKLIVHKERTNVNKSIKEILPRLKPESFNIEKGENKPSFDEFFNKVSPKDQYENILVVSYYLEKYLHQEEFDENQVYFVYRLKSLKEPKRFHQTFIDAKNKKFYFETGSAPTKWKLAPIGRNYIIDRLNKTNLGGESG